MLPAKTTSQTTRILGFDYLRAIALTFVVIWHQLAVLDLTRYGAAFELDLGQLGVSIFLVISGVLAASRHSQPNAWLFARLKRIYPAYWIVTVLGFLAAGVSGYKTFGVGQVISQLIGTSIYTHKWELVNDATWFISLLLTLYLLTYVALRSRKPDTVIFICAAAIIAAKFAGLNSLLAAHTLAYLIGFLLAGQFRHQKIPVLLVVGLILLLLAPLFRMLAYPAITLLLCACFLQVKTITRPIRLISTYSYEFFLCHGIFLVGSQVLFGSYTALSVFAGLASSVVAAVLIHHAVQAIQTSVPKWVPSKVRI